MSNSTTEITQELPRTSVQLNPGQMIGRYRVVELLGKGGMGEVYRAQDSWLRREVALKVLPPGAVGKPEEHARLAHEAQMLAAFNHPNVAAIYDLAQFAQGSCLVLELVKGEGLDEKLRRGPLPLKEALPLLTQIASALDAAHRAGIVHRDLKPANVRLTPENVVKVLDFGIAKMLKDETTSVDLARRLDLSATTRNETLLDDHGKIIGSPPYMSPEQTRGAPLDQRTDIWAFGCLLYEMLTGQMAFVGNTYAQVFYSIRYYDPDWQALPPAPPALRELLRLCLQKDPELRPKDATELWRRLDDVRQSSVKRTRIVRLSHAPPPEPSAIRRYLLPTLAITVVLLAALLAWERLQRWQNIPEQKYLAIMPFKQMNEAEEEKVLAAGLVKYLGDSLSRIPGLQIIKGSERILSSEMTTQEAAERLGATLVLQGLVQQAARPTMLAYALLNAGGREIKRGTVENPDQTAALQQMNDALAQALGLRYPPPAAPLEQTEPLQERYLKALGYLELSQEKSEKEALDDIGKAISLLGQIISAPGGQQAQYRVALARAYLFKRDRLPGDPVEAQAALGLAKNECDQAQLLDRDAPEIQSALGEINFELCRTAEAAANFQQALRRRSDFVNARLGLANVYSATGKLLEAGQLYQETAAQAPGFWLAHNEWGAFAFTHGRFTQALAEWEKASSTAQGKSGALTNLGNVYLYLGRFDAALAKYRDALVNAQTAESYAGLGSALYFVGDYAQSMQVTQEGLEKDPRPELYQNLGDAAQQLSAFEQAAQAYDQAIDGWQAYLRAVPPCREDYAVILAKLAECQAKRRRFSEALPNIQQALEKAPGHTQCLESAPIVYELAGQRAQALAWAKRAVQSGYCKTLFTRNPVLAALTAEPQFQQITGGACQ